MSRDYETAKLFLIDEQNKKRKFFYRLQAKTQIGREVHKIDEWIPVSENIFRFLQRESWRNGKREDRESRCLVKNENGTIVRCLKSCEECPLLSGETSHTSGKRTGLPLSLEKLVEDGQAPETSISVEEIIEKRELMDALNSAINSLSEKDRYIVSQCYLEGQSERKIAIAIGVSQKTINNNKKRILGELRKSLASFSDSI